MEDHIQINEGAYPLLKFFELQRDWLRFDEMRILSNRMGEEIARGIEENLYKLIDEEFGDFPGIAESLKHIYVPVKYRDHRDKEIEPQHKSSLRKKSVYVVLGRNPRIEDPYRSIGEVEHLIGSAKKDGAEKIYLVAPFMPFGRQERKTRGRTPISAKDFIDKMDILGVDGYITMDLHAGAIEGFTRNPVVHLNSRRVIMDYIRENIDTSNSAFAGPDYGAYERNYSYAVAFGKGMKDMVEVRKRKNALNVPESQISYSPDLNGKKILAFDDMIDSGSTIENLWREVRSRGASELHVFATHGIFSDPAPKRFKNSGIKVYCTNTIPHTKDFIEENSDWLTIIDIYPDIAEAIFRMQMGKSISESERLFPKEFYGDSK